LAPGVTLIELLIVVTIIGLLTTAALKAYDTTLQAGRLRTALRMLDEIAFAIVGNPDMISAGVRVDYGYVGDVGKLPDVLRDLAQEPSGLDSGLWNGPYIVARVAESPQGYLIDAWGDSLVYRPESMTVSSRRGMSILQPDSWITRRLARNRSDVLENQVSGLVLDAKGNPPEPTTPIKTFLRYPAGGRNRIDSFPTWLGPGNFLYPTNIPVGNHQLTVRLVLPPDTHVVTKLVSVMPGGRERNWVEVRMPVPF
jgi:prepilin-type N-terminal cleavage/methylation domain-containing protein